jgi:hypothetical protein
MVSSQNGLVRRRWTSEQWQRLLARFHQSQLTQRDFAAREVSGSRAAQYTAALRGGGCQFTRLDRALAKQFQNSNVASPVFPQPDTFKQVGSRSKRRILGRG